jgi:signal transduction histidine kinase
MIAAMRLTLASSALLIIYLDPTQPDRFVDITYGALVLYTLYSGVLLAGAFRQNRLARSVELNAHWWDVAWYLALIALSSGTSSIFFFFFIFSILVASFRHGFASGLKVVIVSSVLFTIIGYLTATPTLFKIIGYPPAPPDLEFELNRFLLRPIYLLVLGYMIAYWGGRENTLKRRLALLKDISLLSNPRFGVNRTIGSVLERVRAFYNADICALVLRDDDTGRYRLSRADRRDPEAGMHPEVLTEEMAMLLTGLPADYAAICNTESRSFWPGRARYFAYDTQTNERRMDGHEACRKLAILFDSKSLATAPVRYRSEAIGKMLLTSNRPSAFDRSDTDFLMHVFEQVIPVIENIRLVDRLASDAAEHERQRIARDLHDSVIQPYIGLQIGLAAIRQKLEQGASDAKDDLSHLAEMTELAITDLRRYVRGLAKSDQRHESLLPSVRRFAAKFGEATGIRISIEPASDIRIDDRLAAEVFQMIAEGLSNIRRHTQATTATIKMASSNGHLALCIENEQAVENSSPPFKPRSIAERAEALGGRWHIEQSNGSTSVIIEIPL